MRGELRYRVFFGPAQGLLQRGERARSGSSLRSRERDVRVVGAVFGSKSAGTSRSRDLLLQREKFRGEHDSSVEDADTVEKIETLHANRNGRRVEFLKTRNYAGGLFVGGLAQELEGDVPAFFGGPADLVPGMWREPAAQHAERFRSLRGERDGDEEAHGRTRVLG